MAERKSITKKVINAPENCVDENLRGVVTLFPKLQLHPKHRVVTVRAKGDSGRVAVLGGGGSGHEPFAAGLTGSGMLDGAVAGDVFASPPTGHVLYAITQLYKHHSGGVLVVIGNYTGDRLNFGKAIEKAKISGIKVEGVIIGEDVASSENKTGGRGMCGEVIFYKLSAAMSIRGYELSTIRDMVVEITKYIATLGVCLSACSLPGQPPLFEIAKDEMELGAGVHGEAGIEKLKMGTANEIVKLILDKIITHLKLAAGDRVVVAINNLGSTSILEMNIISAECRSYLESKNIKVERVYAGHLKASLEMHGFQICILNLNKQYGDLWLEFLDDPTDCTGWAGSSLSIRSADEGDGDDKDILHSDVRKTATGPKLSPKEQDILKESLKKAAEELIKNEELLNRLDSGCGDGDCGNTIRKFSQAVQSYQKNASLECVSSVLWDLSEIAETDMGGTSGGLYSLGLSAASQTAAGATVNNREMWLAAWESAMQAITKYGGAEPGDRTMLDTLHSAAVVFKDNLNSDLKSALQKTAEAADVGSKATAKMIARAGRASYVASGYVHDEDAGARAAAVWMQSILSYVVSQY